MAQFGVRYIVDSVENALPFYTDVLNFEVKMHPATGFAALARGDLELFLNEPGAGSAGQPDDAGHTPSPGGWNRIQLVVDDLDAVLGKLKQRGASVRTSMAEGPGGRQAIVGIRPAIRSSCSSRWGERIKLGPPAPPPACTAMSN